MGDMSQTERLRELLDERGAEHTDTRFSTMWLKDELGYRACVDESDGTNEGLVYLHLWCTPEQAVEATLGPSDPREHGLIPHFWTGDETLHIDLGKLPERIDVTLPDPRGREVYSARVYRFEPEREECHMVTDGDGWWECDACGGTIDWDSCDENDPPSCNYCPNCGRKVVDA